MSKKKKNFETDLFGNEKQRSILDEIYEMEVHEKEIQSKKSKKGSSRDIFGEEIEDSDSGEDVEDTISKVLGFEKDAGKKKKKKEKPTTDIFQNKDPEDSQDECVEEVHQAPQPKKNRYNLRKLKFIYNRYLDRFGIMDGTSPVVVRVGDYDVRNVTDDEIDCLSTTSTDLIIEIISMMHPTVVFRIDEFVDVCNKIGCRTMDPQFIFTKIGGDEKDTYLFGYYIDMESLNDVANIFDFQNRSQVRSYLSMLKCMKDILSANESIRFSHNDSAYVEKLYELTEKDPARKEEFIAAYTAACESDPDDSKCTTPLVYAMESVVDTNTEFTLDDSDASNMESDAEEVIEDTVVDDAENDVEEAEVGEDEVDVDDSSEMDSAIDEMINAAIENDGDLDDGTKSMIVQPR